MRSVENLKILKCVEESIIEDLIVTDIIPDLRNCKLFTQEDEEIVLHEITSKAKNIKLLDIIREKDDELFDKFCDILRTTNEDIAESMVVDNKFRSRRMSQTSFGEVLIKGGVPDRSGDYVRRPKIEKQILDILKSSSKKPILVHGVIGCGKTSVVSNLLYTEDLFSDHYYSCCWMKIGQIEEKDVNSKLATLLKKLNPKAEIPMNNISEILVDKIKECLYDSTTLLILDDIWSIDIMKYFSFHNKYIVTSRQSNLFRINTAEIVEIPAKFEINDCEQLLNYHEINPPYSQIIEKSHRNPLFLSIICNLIKSNSDFIHKIDQIDFSEYLNKVLEEYVKILDNDVKSKYEMLSILQLDETISVDLLAIYWDVDISTALNITTKLCGLNLLFKNWNKEFDCNMYGVFNIHLKYLHQNKNETEKFSKLFIERYLKKYKCWLDINHSDPFFLVFYVKTLYSMRDFEKLTALYTDYSFIAAKIVICGLATLPIEYEKYRPLSPCLAWNDFEKLIMKCGHKITGLPTIKNFVLRIEKVFRSLIQLGFYEHEECDTFKQALNLKKLSKWKDFWDWANPRNSIKTWEISHGNLLTNVDVNKNYIIMASENGQVRLLEFFSGKCLFDYKISDSIILAKFINNNEFIIIDSKVQFWIYNLSQTTASNHTNNDYDDEDDDFDECESQNNEPDIVNLQEKFQNLLVNDFLSCCKKSAIVNSKLVNSSIKALLFGETIVFLSVNEGNSYVAYYDFQGRLKDDFKIEFSVKKFIFFPSLPGFYVLKDDCGKIILFDEFGKENSSINIENQVIIDFTVKGDEVFCAVQNKIYKKHELLFTINAEAYINKISISEINSLLALCLTNDCVQIWDYSVKEYLYSINDSRFTDVYFPHDTNYLITFGENNVAKWDINSINLATNNQYNNNNNNNTNNAQFDSLVLYRRNFRMHQLSSSSFLLALQRITNNLELCTYNHGKLNSKVISEESEVSCFFFYNNYLFVGFKTSGFVKVYDFNTNEKVQEFIGYDDINYLCAFQINNDVFGLLIYHSSNLITILHLNVEKLTILQQVQKKLPKNISVCKIFKCGNSQLIIAIVSDDCSLITVDGTGFSDTRVYSSESNILDLDISENNQYLCNISENGEIKIFEIGTDKCLENEIENCNILRKCKFRNKTDSHNWNVVAIINDKAEIFLFYFNDNKSFPKSSHKINVIIEDLPTKAIQLPKVLKWSLDGNYLLVADYDIRKWKVPFEPRDKDEVKLPLTNLQSYFGGITNIHLNENFICTVDQQGFLYILKKIE